MINEHLDDTPNWIESSALAAPALLGAAVGMLLGELLHQRARRGTAFVLGGAGVAAMLPFLVDGVAGMVSGPRSRIGVRRRIQRIRDAGIGAPVADAADLELREQGVI